MEEACKVLLWAVKRATEHLMGRMETGNNNDNIPKAIEEKEFPMVGSPANRVNCLFRDGDLARRAIVRHVS